MSGVGGVIRWGERPIDPRLPGRMMRTIRHRGPDGLRHETRGRVSLGHALLVLCQREAGRCGPVWGPDGSGVVADARLYNRQQIATRLGLRQRIEALSDAELILAGYQRLGDGLPELLDGDYAFVVWDAAHQRVFAACDPFGIKPLHYHWDEGWLLFGTEPKQMLAAGLPPEPNDELIGEYLLYRFERTEQTFFAGINRVKPGHALLADRHGAVQRRHWWPDPGREDRLGSPRAYAERFRELLRQSVKKRLQVDRPVAAELSGGVDSPAIVMLAADLARAGEPLPPLFTVSAVFPGLDCDESKRIDAVTRRVPFASERYCPLTAARLTDDLAQEQWRIDGPHASGANWDAPAAALIAARGGRVVLSGIGGDDLFEDGALLADLLDRGRVARVLKEAWGRRSRWLLSHALRQQVPEPLKRIARRVRRLDGAGMPDFLAAGFAARLAAWQPRPVADGGFGTRVQRAIFHNAGHPLTTHLLDAREARAAYAGHEPRYPFFDRALAEFVLAIPLFRRPLAGRPKELLRRAVGGDLPPELLARSGKLHYGSWVQALFRRDQPLLRELVAGGPWRSGRYLDRAAAERVLREPARYFVVPACFKVAAIELWLRRLPCYITSFD